MCCQKVLCLSDVGECTALEFSEFCFGVIVWP